ncbi:hypothetical protein [Candidatus Doolittlea endobia]|uniref:hypothetical protein n=1 Tax=Candidatus Doolittlea endobia TaxID=1778262 RepID=UPI0013154FB8|nr:hypothetical protein [Candidatus Doolittlea endobia]
MVGFHLDEIMGQRVKNLSTVSRTDAPSSDTSLSKAIPFSTLLLPFVEDQPHRPKLSLFLTVALNSRRK